MCQSLYPPDNSVSTDIETLAAHFLKKLGAPVSVGFSDAALTSLKAYSWPGNIRELQNAVERGFILRRGDKIGDEVLGLTGGRVMTEGGDQAGFLELDIPDDGISLEEVEKTLIRKALEKSGGNRSEAARLLKIPGHVLIYRLEIFDL